MLRRAGLACEPTVGTRAFPGVGAEAGAAFEPDASISSWMTGFEDDFYRAEFCGPSAFGCGTYFPYPAATMLACTASSVAFDE
jgi:hypothetical protein